MTHSLLPKPDAGADDTIPGDATEPSGSSMRTQDVTTFPFQTISSGDQLGRSGILCIWGSLYFGSVVGP